MPEIKERDVVIAWGIASVPTSLQAAFTRPTVFITLPNPPGRKYREQVNALGWPFPIRRLVQRRLGSEFQPARIALLGFSESCQGVRQLLSSQDAGLVDTAIAIDGIHAGFVGGEPNRDLSNISMPALAPWIEYAYVAAWGIPADSDAPLGRRHCIITHSSIGDQLAPPFKFASTTRTAAWIMGKVFEREWPEMDELPPGIVNVAESPPYVSSAGTLPGGQAYPRTEYPASPDRYVVAKNGLIILGYNNLDPTGVGDHKYQAQRVLPRVLERLLIARWNSEDPHQGVCVSGALAQGPPDGSAQCWQTNPGGVTVPPGDWGSTRQYGLDWRRWAPNAPPPANGTPPDGVVGPGPHGEEITPPHQPTAAGAVLSAGVGAFGGFLAVRLAQAIARRSA